MSVLNISEYMTLGIVAKGRNPVFKVRNLYTGKEYALKKVRRTDYSEHLSDFQEVLSVSSCVHPNILKILGFSLSQTRSSNNNEYIINILMDLMDKDLAQEIRERQKTNNHFQKVEMAKITVSLVSALEFMQQKRKLAHRDLKPENVLLNQEGEIFLADFGDSFLMTDMRDTARTLVGKHFRNFLCLYLLLILGSPYYMSPELKEIYITGDTTEDFKYDPWKSDVYALGMTLMDAACLKLGQKNTSKAECFKHIAEIYGEEYAELLSLMLEETIETRCDFIQLARNPLFVKLKMDQNEVNVKLSQKEQKSEAPQQVKKDKCSIKTSEKLYNFIEKLPKTTKLGKFYQFLSKIKKIEETKMKLDIKIKRNEENDLNEKVPENYFKYFDCQ